MIIISDHFAPNLKEDLHKTFINSQYASFCFYVFSHDLDLVAIHDWELSVEKEKRVAERRKTVELGILSNKEG